MAKAVVAVEAVRTAWIAGGKTYPPQKLKRGQKMLSDDARVKDHGDQFLTVDEIVERATAVPGEKRETKPKPKPKPRKRASDRNAKNKAPKQAEAAKAKKAAAAAEEKARVAREKKVAAAK